MLNDQYASVVNQMPTNAQEDDERYDIQDAQENSSPMASNSCIKILNCTGF
jgi:hypothetical protein